MYHCISINEIFSAMDKNLEITFVLRFYGNNMRNSLVQCGKSIGSILEA